MFPFALHIYVMKIYTDFGTFFSPLVWSRRVHLKAHVSRELYKQKQSTAKHNLQWTCGPPRVFTWTLYKEKQSTVKHNLQWTGLQTSPRQTALTRFSTTSIIRSQYAWVPAKNKQKRVAYDSETKQRTQKMGYIYVDTSSIYISH